MSNNEPHNIKNMTYQERLAAYERQKKTARLVCTDAESYERMCKTLADLWRV